MKAAISFVLAIILMVVCISLLINNIDNALSKEKAGYDKYVGKKVVIQKDTLQVIDYSILEENYTLSNGTKVARKVVEGN